MRLSVELDLAPMASGMVDFLRGDAGETVGLDTVDARSPGVLKLSFNGPKLTAALEAQAHLADSPIGPLWRALSAHWSGDLVVSAAGTLHPVVAIGLRETGDGVALIDGLVETLRADGELSVERLDGELRIGEPPTDVAEAPIALRLRHRVIGRSLVFALARGDLDRISGGKVVAAPLPDDFRRRGQHGLLLWDVPGFFGALPPELLSGPPALTAAADLNTLLALTWARVDALAVTFALVDAGLRLEAWWSLL